MTRPAAHLIVHPDRCQFCGSCNTYFDMDVCGQLDTRGSAAISEKWLTELRPKLEAAIDSCPHGALALIERG